jgi:hypothetical protein
LRAPKARSLRDVLEQSLRRLPERYRSAVVLRDVEGLSTSEAAEMLGLREAAFKSRLHRGRMALSVDVAAYLNDLESASASRPTELREPRAPAPDRSSLFVGLDMHDVREDAREFLAE